MGIGALGIQRLPHQVHHAFRTHHGVHQRLPVGLEREVTLGRAGAAAAESGSQDGEAGGRKLRPRLEQGPGGDRGGDPRRRPNRATRPRTSRPHADGPSGRAADRRHRASGASPPRQRVAELLRRAPAVGGQLLERGGIAASAAGGTLGRLARSGGGCSVRTLATMACELGPVNGGSPASISYVIAPSA